MSDSESVDSAVRGVVDRFGRLDFAHDNSDAASYMVRAAVAVDGGVVAH